jgi:hypothetical protein
MVYHLNSNKVFDPRPWLALAMLALALLLIKCTPVTVNPQNKIEHGRHITF